MGFQNFNDEGTVKLSSGCLENTGSMEVCGGGMDSGEFRGDKAVFNDKHMEICLSNPATNRIVGNCASDVELGPSFEGLICFLVLNKIGRGIIVCSLGDSMIWLIRPSRAH